MGVLYTLGTIFLAFTVRILYIVGRTLQQRQNRKVEFEGFLSDLPSTPPGPISLSPEKVSAKNAFGKARYQPKGKKLNLIAVLGSGGHTTEMGILLQRIDRSSIGLTTYVVADTDTTSQKRFDDNEMHIRNIQSCPPPSDRITHQISNSRPSSVTRRRSDSKGNEFGVNEKLGHIGRTIGSDSPTEPSIPNFGSVDYVTLPRSREVGQSYVTSIFTTLKALLFAFVLVWKKCPDVIIVNGPGTCVPICWSAFIMKILGMKSPRIYFVESFARVVALSLSGKLLYPIADRFIVQWPQLAKLYPAAEYIGRLC